MSEYIETFKVRENLDRSLGQNGQTLHQSTTAATGTFFAVQAVTDITFTTLTGMSTASDVTAVTFPAQMIIYGDFSAVTLATGTAIIYNS